MRSIKKIATPKNLLYTASALGLLGISIVAARFRSHAAAAAFPMEQVPVENKRWGFSLNEYQLVESKIQSGDILGEILMKQGMTYPQVAKLVETTTGKFNIKSMRAGRALYFLNNRHETTASYLVYEPSPYEYVVFNLKEPFGVELIKRDVKTTVVASSGILETNFWQALTDNGLNDELADGMIDVLSSSVDFYHQKVGDRFKVVYEQHFVEGKAVGTGKIIAAAYQRDGKEYYAFNYNGIADKSDYFDFDGRPARKAFLKSPVKFSRISSRFNLNRLHPILKYHKAHFGTDYAAPYGTPIMSVAAGTVVEAGRRGGNGNFVKIRHDGAIETQYLHMQGFARGIRPGTRVAQGQTIGYVGSTGLATGPHVCFRFWKNGRQVDHLRLNLPQPNPITGKELEQYVVVRDSLYKILNAVPYRTKQELDAANGNNMEKVAP